MKYPLISEQAEWLDMLELDPLFTDTLGPRGIVIIPISQRISVKAPIADPPPSTATMMQGVVRWEMFIPTPCYYTWAFFADDVIRDALARDDDFDRRGIIRRIELAVDSFTKRRGS